MALFGFEFCQSLHARTIESVLMVVVKLERQPYSVNVFPIKKDKIKNSNDIDDKTNEDLCSDDEPERDTPEQTYQNDAISD